MLFFLSLTLADDCLPLSTWTTRAQEDLVAGAFDKVAVALQSAEASLDCAVASPEDLGRFWLVQGALRSLQGDDAGARLAFAASRRVAPDGWDPALGAALKAVYDSAKDGEHVHVTVDTNQDRILLDGVRVREWPAATHAGLVSVQVEDHAPGQVVGHKIFTVPADAGEVVLSTGLPEIPRPDPRSARKGGVPWLIAGGGVLAAGGGAAVYTLTQRAASGTANTIADATAARDRQVIGAWTSVGLAGAGVLLGAVGTLVVVF